MKVNFIKRSMSRGPLACALLLCTSGCASDLARASSPATGCPRSEIQIEDISVGWAETSWSARCRGTRFHCAGEQLATCTPERTDSTDRSS